MTTESNTIERLYQRMLEARDDHTTATGHASEDGERPAGAARLEALLRSVDAMTGECSAFELES